MFSQSLVQVFKGLAEFHGYVPTAPVQQTESNQAATTCPVKPAAVPPNSCISVTSS
ncbi:hypothetical protein [Rheinheimera soli]|jgi:hypothetical protein|uniref:Uncharacterized protein n=1 Tax=Rheinheimera soli TaxID=443616 RepID=A0ABU1VZ67_9GAMM|nr:hypothetical protein [Rheinheimera soli]MDR7120865.1 hypothetical protein [Rheinheimera soli]